MAIGIQFSERGVSRHNSIAKMFFLSGLRSIIDDSTIFINCFEQGNAYEKKFLD